MSVEDTFSSQHAQNFLQNKNNLVHDSEKLSNSEEIVEREFSYLNKHYFNKVKSFQETKENLGKHYSLPLTHKNILFHHDNERAHWILLFGKVRQAGAAIDKLHKLTQRLYLRNNIKTGLVYFSEKFQITFIVFSLYTRGCITFFSRQNFWIEVFKPINPILSEPQTLNVVNDLSIAPPGRVLRSPDPWSDESRYRRKLERIWALGNGIGDALIQATGRAPDVDHGSGIALWRAIDSRPGPGRFAAVANGQTVSRAATCIGPQKSWITSRWRLMAFFDSASFRSCLGSTSAAPSKLTRPFNGVYV